METCLDFNNVLIKPKKTKLTSRKDVNLIREFSFKYTEEKIKCLPIMASNMDTVGTFAVFETLSKYQMMTCFHKFVKLEEYKNNRETLWSKGDLFVISIGFSDRELKGLVDISEEVDFKMICIDVANGYMEKFVEFCAKVRDHFPHKIIIAGNVVTEEMTRELILNGKVDVVKVGIGNGSACTTRIKTGVGMPQLTAIQKCSEEAKKHGGRILSDGGITCPGDLGKAFGSGADFVMIGGLFAGHKENPGEVIEEDGRKFKLFYGMSSCHAMKKNYNGVNKYRTSEGRCLKIPFRGELSETVDDLLGGLRSTCTYTNTKNLEDLEDNVEFMLVHNQFNSSLL